MDRIAGGDQYLLFRSGSCVGAIALENVREVMRPLPVEAITGAPLFVLGMAVVRGQPTPVIDAARLLNDAVFTDPARFISLRVGARSACLAVDAVLDVRTLPQDHLHPAPALLRDSSAVHLPLIGALDHELLVVLNTARLVPDGAWSTVQAAAGRA